MKTVHRCFHKPKCSCLKNVRRMLSSHTLKAVVSQPLIQVLKLSLHGHLYLRLLVTEPSITFRRLCHLAFSTPNLFYPQVRDRKNLGVEEIFFLCSQFASANSTLCLWCVLFVSHFQTASSCLQTWLKVTQLPAPPSPLCQAQP